jgi:hypothetical protein
MVNQASLSELLPHLSTIVEEGLVQDFIPKRSITIPHALHEYRRATFRPPRMGSWFSYGLGSENRTCPRSSSDDGRWPPLTNNAWAADFSPRFIKVATALARRPVLFVSNPPGMGAARRRQSLDAVRDPNQMRYMLSGRESPRAFRL